MKKILINMFAGALLLSACSPVNYFTKLQKLPREYSENYSVSDIKAPKSELHNRPWLVYSDRVDNAAYVNPGGRVKSTEVGWLDTFLVIKQKGDYLRLIEYKPDHVRNNRLTGRKKTQYAGWVHRSRLILSPSSVIDVRTGLHDKWLTVITDTTAVMNPEAYFVSADSLKVFGDPDLQRQIAATEVHAIVYVLKQSADGRSMLVSKTPEIKVDKVGEQVIGWVPKVMLKGVGQQLFAKTPFSQGIQSKTWKYAPVIRPYHTELACSFVSGSMVPVIDPTDNLVFNIDGKAISYDQSRKIKQDLKRVNVLFAMEQSSKLFEQYPMLLNAIQNLRPLFSSPNEPLIYNFGGTVVTGRGIETIPLTADYEELVDRLTEMASRVIAEKNQPFFAWKALKNTLDIIGNDSGAVNLIVSIGETGEARESAPNSIVEALQKKNCRLLGWQLHASWEDKYNNYILQLSDMIRRYSDYQTSDKRQIVLYADQFCRSNLLRDAGNNFFMLDYPYASMNQGGFLFPEKGESLPLELFTGAVDSIVTQIRAEHLLLSASIDRAFSTVGGTKSRLDSTLIETYHLPQGMKPSKEFRKIFDGAAPVWYKETPRTAVLDSLMRYYLLLSEPELKQAKERLGSLCAMELDVKGTYKLKKGKTSQLCRYLEETEFPDDEPGMAQLQVDMGEAVDTVYISTKKARRHLYNFYLSELSNCRICRVTNKEMNEYSLSYIHRQIFGVPSNNRMLDHIKLKDLKARKHLPDKQLDKLIRYFKESKENMIKKSGEEKITTQGQNYYYIDSKLLP